MDLSFLSNVYVRAALAGALAAAAVDIAAFKSWQSADDALSYNWGVALFRWAQGAVVGLMSAVGVGTVA
jgi:hypothetical protein